MAKIKLNGDTSGYIEISAPAVSGNNTLELGPGTKILTNLDNTFTGVSTFTSGLHITGGGFILNQQRSDTHTSLIIDKPDAGTGTLKFFNNGSASAYIQHTGAEHLHYYLPSGSGYHAFYTNGTERLRIDSSSGNLLLKTGEIDMQGGNKTVKTSAGFLQLGTSGSHHTAIITAGSERLRVDSSGHLLHGVTADEDTSGNGGLRFINSGDIQIDGDQKALVFRSTNNTAQLQSAIEWWNENGAGVQTKIACDRTAVSQAPSDLVFYTSPNVDLGGAGSDGAITERLRIRSDGRVTIGAQVINTNSMLSIHRSSSDESQIRFTNTTTGEGGNNGLLVGIDSNEHGRIFNQENTPLRFGTNNTERVRITNVGRMGIDSASPISKLQVGSHTFNGGNGMHSDDRVGMSNHGNLTGLMLASTYNDSSHPEYGLVFVQGPNTSSYNVWGICPDGPAKGNSLNLHYGAQTSNIHTPSNRKFEFTGDGYLLKPNHPSFRVGRHTDYSHTGGQPLQFNTTSGSAHLNIGNHYNTSTHRFVAPVGGVYQFSACVIVNGIANNTDLTDLFYLYKNGSNMAYSMRRGRYVSGSTGAGGYYVDFMSNVNILMAANDYCDIRVRLSLSVHGNSSYTWFTGTLVG